MTQTILVPVRITRSIEVLATRKNKTQISRVFHAEFGKGVVKMLREVCWVRSDLIKACEVGAENEAFLSPEWCPLYKRDWSGVPTFGEWKKHLPPFVAPV